MNLYVADNEQNFPLPTEYHDGQYITWYHTPNFFTREFNNPSMWPLLMDGDTPRIFSIDNPQATSPVRERFSARHNGNANALMADGHIESVSYGDTRWSQRNLNTNNYFIP